MRHPSAVTTDAPTWQAAWQRALYAEEGFYRRAAPAQHFATATQGIPGAGALLAEAVAALARRHGCSAVVDVGAGRGELLTALRMCAPDLGLTGVDVVPRPAGVPVDSWLVSPGGAALPAELDDLRDTLVLAHEWLDVVPCPVVQRDRDQVWREVHVSGAGESLGPAVQGPALDWTQRWVDPAVHRAEIGLPREAAVVDLVSRVRSGWVVAVDYGYRRHDRPRQGTLTGFRAGCEVDPVPDGTCDLTAHVAVDALAEALGTGAVLARQTQVLRELLGDPGDPVPHALARSDPAAYLRAVARRSALGALTTGALGDFWWLGVPVPADRHQLATRLPGHR